MQDQKKKIQELFRKYDSLKSDRSMFENIWDDVAKYFRPIGASIISKKMAGDKSALFVPLDSLPSLAAETFSNILNAVITDRSTKWFALTTEDEKLAEVNEVSNWLNKASEVMWNVIYNPLSNFEQSHKETLKDLSAFGTIATKIEEGRRHIVNFNSLNIRDYLIGENDEGKVDTIILSQDMEAKQIVQKFGIENVNQKIASDAEKQPYNKHEIRFFVMPRLERDSKKIDVKNKPFAGYWIDVRNKEILEETGFDTMPIVAGRTEKATGEIYGTSRAMMALADARQLQRMWADYNDAIEKMLKPPLIVSGEFEKRLNLSPMAVNYVKPGYIGNQRPVEAMVSTTELSSTLSLIQLKQQSIKEVFFLDKIKIMDNPNATATQVLELRAEGFRIMSSLATALQEYLSGVLDRVFDMLIRKSFNLLDGNYSLLPDAIFPELPEQLKGEVDGFGRRTPPNIKVKFINPINQSQQVTTLNSIDVLIQTALNLAQAQPDVIDKINFDKVVSKKATIMGIDPELIRDEQEVSGIREQRQQSQAQQQEMLNAGTEAQTMATMKKAGL